MGKRQLFIEADSTRDRALGVIWGAACGARLGHQGSSLPSRGDMLIHLSESLIENPSFDIQDVLRRLIRTSAPCEGTLVLKTETEQTIQASIVGRVAAVDPARCVAVRRISASTAFAALAAMSTLEASYIFGGALIGAQEGSGTFFAELHADRVKTQSAKLECLVDQLLTIGCRGRSRCVDTGLPF